MDRGSDDHLATSDTRPTIHILVFFENTSLTDTRRAIARTIAAFDDDARRLPDSETQVVAPSSTYCSYKGGRMVP